MLDKNIGLTTLIYMSKQICPICSSYMHYRGERNEYFKCPTCAYTCLITKVKKMQDLISLKDYLMGRDERYPNSYNHDIKDNAIKLLQKVNALLNELGLENAKVSSGWRPPEINGKLTNAAKRSYHMLGMAVDLLDDKNQTLGKLIASRPDLLKKYDLWLEDLNSTIGQNTDWCHLDVGQRADRPSRIFKP